MSSQNKISNHPLTLQEILDAVSDEGKQQSIISRLNASEIHDDEVLGAKYFLEENDYDFSKLTSFIHNTESHVLSLQPVKKQPLQWVKVAALLVPLIGISFLLMYLFKTQPNEELVAKYKYKEVGLPVMLSSESDKLFNESMSYYRNEEYKKASGGFYQLVNDQPNDTLYYFLGVSEFEQEEFQKSIDHLANVNEGVFKERSEYFLAMIYLQLDQISKSKELLMKIEENPNHEFYSKAQDLLKEDLYQ